MVIGYVLLFFSFFKKQFINIPSCNYNTVYLSLLSHSIFLQIVFYNNPMREMLTYADNILFIYSNNIFSSY